MGRSVGFTVCEGSHQRALGNVCFPFYTDCLGCHVGNRSRQGVPMSGLLGSSTQKGVAVMQESPVCWPGL